MSPTTATCAADYCFAGQGGLRRQRRKLMSLRKWAKAAIDYLLAQIRQGRRNLELDFFGGEPTDQLSMWSKKPW